MVVDPEDCMRKLRDHVAAGSRGGDGAFTTQDSTMPVVFRKPN